MPAPSLLLLYVRMSELHSASLWRGKLHIRWLILPFHIEPAMLGFNVGDERRREDMSELHSASLWRGKLHIR